MYKLKMKRSSIKRIVFSFILILLTATFSSAAATTVYIQDISVKHGENITTPIMINNATNVKGAHIFLNYDGSVVEVISIDNSDLNFETFKDINNSAGSTCYAVVNIGDGLNKNVKFAEVTLRAAGNEGDSSPLNLDVVSLNGGGDEIPRVVDSGTFNIEAPTSTAEIISGGGGGGGSTGGGGSNRGDSSKEGYVTTPTPVPTPLKISSRTAVILTPNVTTEPSLTHTQPTTPCPTKAPTPPTRWILLSGAVFMIAGSSIASYFISQKR